MNIKSAFPSKYIRESDLGGKDYTLTIQSVQIEDLGGEDSPKDRKPVVMFKETSKGLGLNRINSNTIAKLLGEETDQWTGKRITLFPTTTEFKGDTVPCVRVRDILPPQAAATTPAAPEPLPVGEDDIPF